MSLARWHPEEERWEDADKPLPATPAEHAAEEADEAELSAEQGFAEWEVRVGLPSHRETVEFAERLDAEASRCCGAGPSCSSARRTKTRRAR